ncbi:MAG: histidinol dehydrogenase [Solirubrobacterales bacterium]
MLKIERIEWDGRDAPALATRLRSLAPSLSEVSGEVTDILGAVRSRGDAAIRELSRSFDEPAPESLRIDPEAVAAAPGLLEPEVREALRAAAANIDAVARAELAQLATPTVTDLPEGQRVELRFEPVPYAGIYAPGGKAAYPSSLLMCAIPALAAGVGRLAVASPPSAASGRPSGAVLAACAIAGVEEVYAVGGAQAIAAFAFGTETIPQVDVIAGPGNRYVTEAKRIVSGEVGIDGVAGPSELTIVADASADPRLVALDLCAQGEHGDDSSLLLISPDPALIDAVAEAVETLAAERPSVASASLALVQAPGVQRALELSDAYAPEHLELAFDGADDISARARLAGCVFIGDGGATAFGDYAAGSNHVLPTGGAARFGGPLGPRTFMRRSAVVTIPARAARALAPTVDVLARAEGLPVHGESAVARSGDNVGPDRER